MVFSLTTENQADAIVSKMASFLPACWPKLVETLSKTASAKSWDVIRCLVLGPPEKEVAKTIMNPGWKYADRFKDGEKVKVLQNSAAFRIFASNLHVCIHSVN